MKQHPNPQTHASPTQAVGLAGAAEVPSAPAPHAQPASVGVKVAVRDVSKIFVTRSGPLPVLDRVSIDVREGEFVCLVGPSGCGKTTLFQIVAGLLSPDAGEVRIDGRQVTGPGPDRVVVFQDGALFPWLTALGNVEFGLEMIGVARQERRRRALAALEMVHLAPFAQARIHELSGGMRQRVAIARALAMDPAMLLMDEPFASLDAQTRNVLHDELQAIWLATGKTILFVTHNVEEAVKLGDRVITMTFRPGRIRREYAIRHPRPRHVDDAHLLEMRTFILRDLQAEVRRATLAELTAPTAGVLD